MNEFYEWSVLVLVWEFVCVPICEILVGTYIDVGILENLRGAKAYCFIYLRYLLCR